MNCLFEEKQKFTQWWVWTLLFLTLFVLDKNTYTVLIGGVIIIFFYLLELRIKVKEEAVYYQFFPLHIKSFSIKKNEIEKIESLKYRPLGDYGGWGIRYSFKGKCYNVKGNLGVKVFLKNGSYILFGSQKHLDFEKSLRVLIQQGDA